MPDKKDDPTRPVDRALAATLREVGRERADYENEGPRDSGVIRWAKFASIVAVLALLFGAGFALQDYYLEYDGKSFSQRSAAAGRTRDDSSQKLKTRFYLGAAIGAAAGIAYVVRCIRKKEDP